MKRRDFLQSLGLLPLAGIGIDVAFADARPGYDNLLILIELKGGNDGRNSVVPYADAGYCSARPKIAVARDQVLQLLPQTGLHPSLAPLMPLWDAGELALIQGVGYPQPNLSHFRSIEIWDTASASDQFLAAGWLARTFAAAPTPRDFAADGVVIGAQDLGPLAGEGARTIALSSPGEFLRRARLAGDGGESSNRALGHLLRVEDEIGAAAQRLVPQSVLATNFPQSAFGNSIRSACQVLAATGNVAALRVTLNGFDTHANQQPMQARLLKELVDGLVALRAGLVELGRWRSTVVMTYAEFGRRVHENGSQGTDHGTANAHFALGGRIRGGLYGEPPRLARLDGNGNLPFSIDFRSLYATVLERWWGVPAKGVLGERFATLDFFSTA